MPEMTPLRKIIGEAIPTPPVPKSLVTKLAEVMAAVERIPKRGTNEFHHYAYATEADIVDAVRKELASRQVLLIPSIMAESRIAVGEKGSVLTVLEMEMEFCDGETGERIVKHWRGYGSDKDDKGGYKAMTGGEKYFLLKTFLIPTGDDPDRDEHPGQPVARPVKTPRLDMRGVSAAIARGQDTVKVDMRTGEILTPPAQAAVDAGQGDMLLISVPQRTRLWATAKDAGWKKDEVKAWLLKEYHIDSSSKIPRAKYDEMIARLQGDDDKPEAK